MDPRPAPDDHVALDDPAAMRRWCDHFGITVQQLEEAVLAAGPRAADVERHLRDQGASAGAG